MTNIITLSGGNGNRSQVCPACRKVGSFALREVISDQLRCMNCNNSFTDEEVKNFWKGYDTCLSEVTAERDKLIEEMQRISQEWQSANRMIWLIVKSQGGEIRIPDLTMALGEEPGNYFRAHYEPENLQTVIVSLNDPEVATQEEAQEKVDEGG